MIKKEILEYQLVDNSCNQVWKLDKWELGEESGWLPKATLLECARRGKQVTNLTIQEKLGNVIGGSLA